MTQEVEVLVKMTFEVSTDCPSNELNNQIGHWVRETMDLMDDAENNFSFVDSDIIYLKEESEIYGNR